MKQRNAIESRASTPNELDDKVAVHRREEMDNSGNIHKINRAVKY